MESRYYVYHNWTIGKAIIHLGSCSYCRNGYGIHGVVKSRNSEWYGPFSEFPAAEFRANQTQEKRIDKCKFCLS